MIRIARKPMQIMKSSSILLLFLLYLVPGAFAEELTRTRFEYETMAKKPYESCDSAQIKRIQLALQQVDQSQSKQGVATARDVYSLTKKCPQVYDAYAWSLFRSGELLEGINVIDEGIRAFGSYPDLIRRRGYMGWEMGDLGPTRKIVDGSSISLPKEKGLPYDEKQFKEENYRISLQDFLFLVNTQPEQYEETFIAGYLYHRLGDYEKSNRLFEKLSGLDKYKLNAAIAMTNNYIATKQYGLAERTLLDLESKSPKSSAVYKQLSLVYWEGGATTKAREFHKKALFFQWVPAFTDLTYSDENYRMIAFLVQNNPIEEKQRQLDRITRGLDRQSVIDVCVTILASHTNHGNGLEEKAVQELVRFGKQSVPKVIQMLQMNGVSTCTTTSAGEVLAVVKDERGWQPLVECLPGIAKLPGTIIPPAIPDKIVQFDRERGVKILIPFVRDMIRADQNGDDALDPSNAFGKEMIYQAFYHPLKQVEKTELLKMAVEAGYKEKEIKFLTKGVYGQ